MTRDDGTVWHIGKKSIIEIWNMLWDDWYFDCLNSIMGIKRAYHNMFTWSFQNANKFAKQNWKRNVMFYILFLVYGQRLVFQIWGCFCKKLMSQLYMQVLTRLALSFCLLCLKANVLLSSFITGTQSSFLRFYSNWFCFRPNQALKQSKPDSSHPTL